MRALSEDQVAREDLVLFVNACFACTGQREYYGGRGGQRLSIGFLHEYILGNYRRLYAETLAAGINHFNLALIVENLLATGKKTAPERRAEENALIRRTLATLPPPRVYRLFESLARRGVNNRRTRATIRDYLARRDLAFDAVKYRPKLRVATMHAHLKHEGELGPFLFGGWKQRKYETPLLEQYRQAHYSKAAIFALPFTVAEGLATAQGIDRETILERGAATMTAAEKLRLQTAAAREGADRPELDLGRAPLTKLAIYLLSLPQAERAARRAEFEAALTASARRALARAPMALPRVAAVLDSSRSSYGSNEKKRRPLAVALAASALLRVASARYEAFWTGRPSTELEVEARGQSDLATPILAALRTAPDLLLIVSDGFDNDPPYGVAELLRVFRAELDPRGAIEIVHLNPVFDEEHYRPRILATEIPTVGLRDAEDLPTMLGFARFADGSAPLAELERYLAHRVADLLGGAP